MTELTCSAEEFDDDLIIYMQTVEDSNDRYTVVVGVADGPDVRQHIIRGLGAAALAALQRDVDSCIEADEDLEPVITTWRTMQGG